MTYLLSKNELDALIGEWCNRRSVHAPVLISEGGPYSDTSVVRYGRIGSASEMVTDRKSVYSFKEYLLPLSQTLFFFTENQVKEADCEECSTDGAVIFLRSCDFHALKRLDEIYLGDPYPDRFYSRLRERTKFIVIGCTEPFASCFCADMGTNTCEGWDAAIWESGGAYCFDNRNPEWEPLLRGRATTTESVPFVTDTQTRVDIPESVTIDIMDSKLWDEYDARCQACGRCNFVCPTCTCFTMQDIFYTDNGKAGERRRVAASCMVDGYTDVAGGGAYRKCNGQRMRFKNLHKIHDYKKRFGYHMCVGCGRCDDICPEYISFAESIGRVGEAMRELRGGKANG